MNDTPLVLGVDFGTEGVRVVAVNALDSAVIATGSAQFPNWNAGRYCDPYRDMFRQHPQDLLDGFLEAVSQALSVLSEHDRSQIIGLTIDTTGSSPTAIGKDGRPLALSKDFYDDPASMVILWKDHSAVEEAEHLTSVLHHEYPSEWFWSKVLRASRENKAVRENTITWAEHADWFPAILCAKSEPKTWRRCRSGASHKALWNPFSGYPSHQVLSQVDPYLGAVHRSLGDQAWSPNQPFGVLSTDYANNLGLPNGIPVGVGLFDAHSAALAGGVSPGTLVKVIGTSSSEIAVTDMTKNSKFPGVEGIGVGSIFPELVTIESGQAAYGDLAEWLYRLVSFRSNVTLDSRDDLFRLLEQEARKLHIEDLPLAVDWFNGRRAPFSDLKVSGAFSGLSLGTGPAHLYASLMESAAFATRVDLNHLESIGIQVDSIHVLGGVPDRSQYVVSVLSDVLNREISVRESDSASSRGAAICAAVISGVYPDLLTAQKRLQLAERKHVRPNAKNALLRDRRFHNYINLGKAISL
jgi:L-ribulokinase